MYQSIMKLDNQAIPLGDPAALSIEPLLVWLTNLMDTFEQRNELN